MSKLVFKKLKDKIERALADFQFFLRSLGAPVIAGFEDGRKKGKAMVTKKQVEKSDNKTSFI